MKSTAKSTTTLKLSAALKARISRAAKRSGLSSHAFMLEALERQTARDERMAEFIQEALESDREVEAGGEVYAAEDVRAWARRLANGEKVDPPSPCRE